jgi:protocatechuate 3,4-dioxygenase beta subunit
MRQIRWLIIVTAIIFGISNSYASEVLKYTFEQNNVGDTSPTAIPDESGSGNDGQLRSGATIVTPGADGSDKAFRSQSEDKDYDSVIAQDSSSLSITGDLTLSLWIKPSKMRDSGLITKTLDSDTHNVEYWFSMNSNGNLRFNDNSKNSIIDTDNSYVTQDTWQHVALVRNRSAGKIYFYLNGELKETKDWPTANGSDTDYGLIVGACDPCYYTFVGDMDCVRIYDEALDDAGVQQAKSCAPLEAKLGDFVWHDKNANGIQDSGEEGVANVHVELYASADCSGNVVQNTDTDANGNYSFNVTPGTYCLKFSNLPTDYKVSPKDQGDDAKDSDADPTTKMITNIQMQAGQDDLDEDMGIYKPACIGNYIWYDSNADGIQDDSENGKEGVEVTLYDSNNSEVSHMNTDSNGKYEFCDLVPGDYHVEVTLPSGYQISPKDNPDAVDEDHDSDVDPANGKMDETTLESGEVDHTWDGGIYEPACIGNYVWLDENANGVQDSGESGKEGVHVTLYDASNSAVANMDTDANGKYEFCHLAPGDYHVEVSVPSGYSVSPKDQGDDAKDSDIDPDGKMETTTLDAGENDPNWDAGLYESACIGDFVWLDKNANGVQDAGESGIEDVPVTLYDASNSAVANMNTDANGKYEFCGLVPGDYHVEVSVPSGYSVSPKDQGDDAKDSDIDPDGKAVTTTLESGENDQTWDAGLFQPACIGNYVWEDMNANGIQDAGEVGVAGAKVEDLIAQRHKDVTRKNIA